MTAPEAATFVLARAKAAEQAARVSGVDELRMSSARRYVARFQDEAAMNAYMSSVTSVALYATYQVLCALLGIAKRPMPPDTIEDDKTDPCALRLVPPDPEPKR